MALEAGGYAKVVFSQDGRWVVILAEKKALVFETRSGRKAHVLQLPSWDQKVMVGGGFEMVKMKEVGHYARCADAPLALSPT